MSQKQDFHNQDSQHDGTRDTNHQWIAKHLNPDEASQNDQIKDNGCDQKNESSTECTRQKTLGHLTSQGKYACPNHNAGAKCNCTDQCQAIFTIMRCPIFIFFHIVILHIVLQKLYLPTQP